ncbi:ATP-grasp domain-containing protein [Streptomyces sp. SID13666]|uniref:ATP-grasp domain-containing protein n=1 Tax=unclassified Streptomyces TaxID=2593676 RepID=UPI0013C131B3|nr:MULTISPECIES: ATP-grasp domain-containing protein [unclassified Streptomyces]NEA60341.1 ATP-grasp domain-containing protein [Streptomyces sp. SID13666]NEA77134.1 ATP-grasp domain-containing protein [Streptomyces sp. SID13588]
MGATIIFCADPLNPRRPDANFAPEARAARELGLTVALLDHDALLAGDPATAVARVPRGTGPAWYRGWMVPGDHYSNLAQALDARGCTLLTEPDRYRAAHELPGWYGTFEELTPRSVWLPVDAGRPPDTAALAALTAPLGGGPGIVKDFVKSRKHEWDEACYVPDLADTERLAAVTACFVERQGDFLAGGVVVRAFEQFTDTGEARVWWLDAQPVLVTAHPDTPQLRPRPALDRVQPLVAALGCRFVTTDLALRADGQWRVIEVGDGQVSDLPPDADPGALAGKLASVRVPRGILCRSFAFSDRTVPIHDPAHLPP